MLNSTSDESEKQLENESSDYSIDDLIKDKEKGVYVEPLADAAVFRPGKITYDTKGKALKRKKFK